MTAVEEYFCGCTYGNMEYAKMEIVLSVRNSECSCSRRMWSELQWKTDMRPTAGCPEAQTVQPWKYQCVGRKRPSM